MALLTWIILPAIRALSFCAAKSLLSPIGAVYLLSPLGAKPVKTGNHMKFSQTQVHFIAKENNLHVCSWQVSGKFGSNDRL